MLRPKIYFGPEDSEIKSDRITDGCDMNQLHYLKSVGDHQSRCVTHNVYQLFNCYHDCLICMSLFKITEVML